MWQDLAPEIYRQRLIIEGRPGFGISEKHIQDYLRKLSGALSMKTLIEPVTHRSEKFGWVGWIHWESSGAHFYAWEKPFSFFSVDIYTCKKFDENTAIRCTREFFKPAEIAWRGV